MYSLMKTEKRAPFDKKIKNFDKNSELSRSDYDYQDVLTAEEFA
jgi:hypothetical protein